MTVNRFEMNAPHGTRIYPSTHGCIIEYNDDLKPQVEAWLEAERIRFGQVSSAQEDLVTCPKCDGKLLLRDGVPVFCTLCHGQGKVSKSTAISYTESSNRMPTVVRKQTFAAEGSIGTPPPESPHEKLRQVLQAGPSRVISLTPGVSMPVESHSDDAFVALKPGDEGFIGPIQQLDR